MLALLGAKLELTPAAKGMKGDRAGRGTRQGTAQGDHPQQLANPANPAAHRTGTRYEEIWADTAGKIDILIGGVGTGGTLTGCGEGLKAKNPAIRVIGVEPEDRAPSSPAAHPARTASRASARASSPRS